MRLAASQGDRLGGRRPCSPFVGDDGRDSPGGLALHSQDVTRKDTKEPCAHESHFALLDSRDTSSSTARLDADRTVTFTLPLPDGRDRLRVGLGEARATAILRVDLQAATAEREALAAVTP